MVPHGTVLNVWDSLDPSGPPRIVWPRPVDGRRVVLLLGAFDPPTRAHVAVLAAAARADDVPGALCLTKVLLARPADELVPQRERIALLDAVARARRFGLAIANRGTYLDVGRACAQEGIDASFVIGSDKLAQLADPSFYPDRERGVAATFDELRFLVVPRRGAAIDRDDVRVLDASEVFPDDRLVGISSTEVRRRMQEGADVTGLVPPEVVAGLAGYTAAR
jgi:nicotinic acid mononucleotide adenylyltransferase